MRRLLGVLRTGEHQEGGEYVPQPDVEQIDDLVEQCRTSGLPVDFKVEGTPRPLPSGVELTAYRIVQEALTNTRKHGGPNAGASVRLVYFDDGLGLLVEDDGKGAPHELYEEGGADGAGPRPDRHARARRHGRRHPGRGAAPRRRIPHQCAAAAQTRPLTPAHALLTPVTTPARPPIRPRTDTEEAPMTIRVMLVDDQVLLRTGFRMVLAAQPDMEVVAEAGDGVEALQVLRVDRGRRGADGRTHAEAGRRGDHPPHLPGRTTRRRC